MSKKKKNVGYWHFLMRTTVFTILLEISDENKCKTPRLHVFVVKRNKIVGWDSGIFRLVGKYWSQASTRRPVTKGRTVLRPLVGTRCFGARRDLMIRLYTTKLSLVLNLNHRISVFQSLRKKKTHKNSAFPVLVLLSTIYE